MGAKAEARELRKLIKQQKFEASKPATLARVQLDAAPKSLFEVESIELPKVAASLDQMGDRPGPKAVQIGSRHSALMTWCVSRRDCVGTWSWQELRAWSDAEWTSDIAPKLNQFGKQTWAELDRHAHGKKQRHKMHHGHEITDLVGEAQTRWRSIGLEEFDSIWRFRMGATKRAWGFILQAHFHMVWWDRTHSIYPVAGP